MIRYDANVIRQYAQALYGQANALMVVYTLVGVAVGAAAGSLVDPWVAFLAAVIGGGVAYIFARSASFGLKLQAQIALCQVQIEENTSRSSPGSTASASSIETAPVQVRPKRVCPNCGITIYSATPRCPECQTDLS